METLKAKIKVYYEALGKTPEKIDIQIDMILERTQIYLNRVDIDIRLTGTLAQMLYELNDSFEKNKEVQVSSMSDNGQSVSFVQEPISALVSKSDAELFGSHTSILNRFRRVGVMGENPFKI